MDEIAFICAVILALTGWVLYWRLQRRLTKGFRALARLDMEVRALAGKLKLERKVTRQWKELAIRRQAQNERTQGSA